MWDINIYTYTTIKGPHKRDGAGGYVLEAHTDKGPATLTKFEELTDVSGNTAELLIVLSALRRLNQKCNINIFCSSGYLKSGIEQYLECWKNNGWKTAKGSSVANESEWREIAELLNGSGISVTISQNHEYATWLQRETKLYEQKFKENQQKGDIK